MTDNKEMEVIDLESDDESSTATEDKSPQKVAKTPTVTCINFKCSSGVSMKIAPTFACSYYGVNMVKKKKRFICEKCLKAAIEHQELLVDAMLNKKPLLQCEFPDHTMEVEISDSDESDSEVKDSSSDEYLPEEFIKSIGENIDNALTNVIKNYDIEFQIRESHRILKAQYDQINEENSQLDNDITDMILKMDSLRSNLYNQFRPDVKEIKEIHIEDPPADTIPHPPVATKKVTQIIRAPTVQPTSTAQPDNAVEVMSVCPKGKINMELGLPPQGNLVRRAAEVDNLVLVMKHPLLAWRRAKVLSIVSRTPMTYRIKYASKKYSTQSKQVFGKQLAIFEPCSVMIPVATRVVALFSDHQSNEYYSGVIAEPPKATNKCRYLVFFDDGYAQYVAHKDIFVVSESSLRVWEDIPIESREFVKKYLETYPERPMVKLQKEQVVKTEWNGKWWIARVIQVDASLVQMYFDADGRNEWIYRGSARLGPLFLELLKASARQQGHHAPINTPTRHRFTGTLNKNNVPYVEYTSIHGDQEAELELPSPQAHAQKLSSFIKDTSSVSAPAQSRAVAKKSTAKRSSTPAIVEIPQNFAANSETKPSHSIVYYQTQNKIQTRKFVAHKCGPNCIRGISFSPADLKGYSPLSIPLLCGWNRQLCKFPKGKKVILYQAPCGARLRNMEEVHRYLRITESTMSVDLFDFDYWVHCLAEFVLDKCFVNIKDLSYGVENVPIPCVNEIDHKLPDTITYSTIREPTEGVTLNTDPDFLCSCDCEDDCQDKNKCQCWQMTIQGATFGGRVPNPAVGYVYKRLPEPVTTGIYECNSRCKCSVKTCLNRVVQHPLSLKLQVFKTAPRGWGIRCLNDIPLGSFICIYAGRLLTEQGANEGGKNYGDEYLAELDYVEVVEGIKEGFEAEAFEPEITTPADNDDANQEKQLEDEASRKKGTDDSDEEFNPKQFNQEFARIDTDPADAGNMKSRLRKRKKSTDDGPDTSEDKSEDGSTGKGSNTTDKGDDGSDEDEGDKSSGGMREPSRFEPSVEASQVEPMKFKSVRDFFGEDEAVYIMDAKTTGNIGRYLNHSCDPNVFVQNVFVDTHDVRFPWVAFFALNFIRAGQELTWNYSYDVGSIPGKVIICKCGASNCRGRLL
ncbi:Similar to egg: Histone-lysine N-methyltransferase eggless (Drosophila melanogaster) [Cotesia congregata]|uniref:Similar to egg: Histone-lysine N-methyltransferase eggless (Drosophila melanogaster) n=1 Tax=Cotesia congregata TaxID=51543 RepID=A0A8J2HMH8_COTCN|nr:Similar to egg: Histone-lysine N-methyltransferase eggless (Drosophila melanogaster) [Cotesia congregata]